MKNKIAMVTGAASGIGRATTRLLAGEGAQVFLVDRDPVALAATVQDLVSAGHHVESAVLDISRSEGAQEGVERCVRSLGGLDILVSNAGINPRGTVITTSDSQLEEVLSVNLKATFYLCRYSVPVMKERGGGSIVTVASINALVAWKNEAAYDAAKGGLVMLTRSLAVDFAEWGIRANCVCPGITGTAMLERTISAAPNQQEFRQSLNSMQPLGRIAMPEDIAQAIVFLASDRAAFITGAVIPVDGGYTAV